MSTQTLHDQLAERIERLERRFERLETELAIYVTSVERRLWNLEEATEVDHPELVDEETHRRISRLVAELKQKEPTP